MIGLSLEVSLTAVALASLAGIPAGFALALAPVPWRGLWVTVIHALMGTPPVVMGLMVFLLLSRQGPLGSWGLLFTPTAMVMVQTLLAWPIVTGLTYAAARGVHPLTIETARTLGASPRQLVWVLAMETRTGMLAAVVAGLGRALAEVGGVLMVGGNIAGQTRVMTTAIAMETAKGNHTLALALGMVLIGLGLGLNALLYRLKGGAP